MKKNSEMKWLVLGLLILVGLCVFLTVLIIVHQIKSEPVAAAVSVELETEQDKEVYAGQLADIPPTISGDDVHVLIRNGGELRYGELFITSSVEWYINDQRVEADAVVNLLEYMRQKKLPVASLQLKDDSGYFSVTDGEGNIKKSGYGNILEVRLYDEAAGYDGGAVLINVLPLEEYVRFVLPSEMPSYFSYEAMKAQAVCARTLAVKQRANKSYEKWNADLDDSTDFQVFNELGTNEISDRAAAETAGEVLCFEDTPINCYYYSTSSGNLNDMSVWQAADLPYIRQKNCAGFSGMDFSSEEAIFAFLSQAPESYDDGSPFYRWTATLDFSEVGDELYGKVKGFSVSKRNGCGYATEIKINYENGAYLLANEYEIRKFVGQAIVNITLSDHTLRTNFKMLPSSCFVIAAKDGSCVTLQGAGFGHGIGMSQYGASKMAEDGLDYRAILSFYYEGAQIKTIEELLQKTA